MKKIVIGILAHVDAGKTTLSEAMLYKSGRIRKMGRVDSRDAFLDTEAMEKERGITIFSKQAVFTYRDMEVFLLDTPGHVDFSAEMERTLQVLDYAILVVSGADGVQAHTSTLWRLLARYHVPVFLFINKMDQPGTDKAVLIQDLREKLDDCCIDFSVQDNEELYENIAVSEEAVLDRFLKTGKVDKQSICRLIRERKVFPCFFGSALKGTEVEPFMQGLAEYTQEMTPKTSFAARVFKIARDTQGNRLTYLKVTGGSLKVKDTVRGNGQGKEAGQNGVWEEKINQIRVYSGEKYETADEVRAGSVCAVTGLTRTFPGEGLGEEEAGELPILEPVLSYRVILPEEVDAAVMLPKLRQLEEEEPKLHVVWDAGLGEIHLRIMGEVQLEVIQRLVKDRFGILIEFGQGSIVYKETITEAAIGVGHFEPLRHYAEAQLLLEPGEPGSGLVFASSCSEDVLGRNWQRLVLTHLEEKEHRGVLTGAPVTDMKITLIAGRAHLKHTEGGDFRQAVYRAVRQGLMEAPSILLEPYYNFTLEVPEKGIGRAMTDIERMGGSVRPPSMEEGRAVLTGYAPAAVMRDYQKEVTVYTQGQGRLSCTLKGYLPCHNTEEVLNQSGYDAEADVENPSGSVFCAHGAGYVVPWDEVKAHMHTQLRELPKEFEAMSKDGEDGLRREQGIYSAKPAGGRKKSMEELDIALGTEEIDRILEKTFYANRRDENIGQKGIYRKKTTKASVQPSTVQGYHPIQRKEEYLLVDGYNVIFAWEDLRELAAVNIDSAKGKLLDILCDYQAMRGCKLIVVFDAYRVQGHATEITDYQNIHVVHTKEAETADRYIEKFAHENGKKYQITVATSDGLEQIIIRGQGCCLLSSRELWEEIEREKKKLRENYLGIKK